MSMVNKFISGTVGISLLFHQWGIVAFDVQLSVRHLSFDLDGHAPLRVCGVFVCIEGVAGFDRGVLAVAPCHCHSEGVRVL